MRRRVGARRDSEAQVIHHLAATSSTRTRSALAHARARGGGSAPSSLIIKLAWRLRLYNLLERPNSSSPAVLVRVVVDSSQLGTQMHAEYVQRVFWPVLVPTFIRAVPVNMTMFSTFEGTLSRM
jgi:hypothetical protein